MRHLVLTCLFLALLGATPAAAGGEIAEADLEALRVAGTTAIVPDDATVAALEGAPDRLAATVKVCLTRKGAVKSVKVVESSGAPGYDAEVARTVKATWQFRPYKHKKKARAVCARVVVAYELALPPPPPPPRAETVTPTALEAFRLTGDKNILPDDATKVEIQKAGKTRLVVPVKLCVDVSGQVAKVALLKSSGFTGYDATIVTAMKTWTYRPFLVNGVASPVCTAITFIYTQS
jgi:TonB family protein